MMSETDRPVSLGGMSDDPRRGPSVLVAEDDAGFRFMLAELLGMTSGASVLAAADGIEALQLGLQYRPQLVVLDLHMPRMDGVDVAVTLRDMRPSLPIALQSADPRELHARAGGLGLPLFDKVDLSDLLAWAKKQIRSWDVHAAASALAGSDRVDGTRASPTHRAFLPS
jgi:CheY-like chemotaxis protein